MKDKYLLRGKAGDQYVGCCDSCLDQQKKEFAVSPPYFDFIELCEIDKLGRNRKICQLLEKRLPRYTSISDKTNHLKCAASKNKIPSQKIESHAPQKVSFACISNFQRHSE